MNRILIIALSLLAGEAMMSQKMMTRTGEIKFDASMPDLVEIAATNTGASCIFDESTGEFVALVLIKSFKFKSPLMEEHFNENYINSDTYPKATFKGKIENFDATALTATAKEYTIKGKLELHGKTNEVTSIAKIRKTEGGIEIITNFSVKSDDYAIEIPSVVKSKVSNKVKVKAEFIVK